MVWGVGVPALCIIVIWKKYRDKLNVINVKQRFGFLYNGYEDETFYWEFVIIYRKIAIIMCSVFLGIMSVQIQALTVLIILFISLHLQNQI